MKSPDVITHAHLRSNDFSSVLSVAVCVRSPPDRKQLSWGGIHCVVFLAV